MNLKTKNFWSKNIKNSKIANFNLDLYLIYFMKAMKNSNKSNTK